MVLKVRNLGDRTIETYIERLKAFLYWCEQKDIYPPEITKCQLLEYFCSIKSDSYLRQQRATIDNFYRYVLEIPYILNGMPYPKRTKSLPEYFTFDELLRIFSSVKNNKQRIILKLQYACALRVHEVVRVKWSDFILHRGQYDLRVLGKGRKPALIPVPGETIQEIIAYMGNRFGSPGYLFTGQFKDHYSERSICIIINRAMEECGIYKNGSTHLLRHSRATHLIQRGSSTMHVQQILRHNSSRTTEIYTHLNVTDLRRAIESSDQQIKTELKQIA